MALNIIGIGMADEKDITVKGLELVKQSSVVYLESYTSKLLVDVSALEELYGKKVILADRQMVESRAEETILKDAGEKETAFLVIGDALSATTHLDLMTRAKKMGITVRVVNNASVITAIGVTGLSLYKFGKTASIPYWEKGFEPETPYDLLKENQSIGAHTLMLLDIKADLNHFMTVGEAIEILLKIAEKRGDEVFSEDTLCVGCARLGSDEIVVKAGSAKELQSFDFGTPLHCLIIPGKMHFMEKEALGIKN